MGTFKTDFVLHEYAKHQSRRQWLHTMPYQEYLSTPEWQMKREKAIRQAGGKCQVCGSKDRIEVHHKSYERRGYEAMSDLVVLCARCHKNRHGL